MLNSVKKNKTLGVVVIILLLLILDQLLKFWVKTHMHLYESIEITSWFYISFTENPGMAFGIELVDKLLLTIFRIIAVIFIGGWIHRRKPQRPYPQSLQVVQPGDDPGQVADAVAV